MTSAGVLQGYRVVEVGVWVAGPSTSGLLADWGADVIKVEAPRGDPMRSVFKAVGVRQERVPPFELDNRGKRSVVLDLQTDAGRDALHRLLEAADVFVTNLRPDALERLGLDADTVRARHPRLVYAGVSGYGAAGPDRDRAGYDIGAFWARSGLAATHVPGGELPPALRSAVGDHVTGITTAAGVLAALLERERTGEGRTVTTSLLRTGIWAMGWDIGVHLYFGRIQSTRPRTRQPAPLVNCYSAADERGFWLLGLEQDRHWPGLLAAIDRPDLADDPRFADAFARGQHCEALIEILDEVFASRPFAEWVEAFDAHNVWWAPINTIPDVIADPQAAAAGAWVDMPVTGDEPPYRAVASPVSFDGQPEHPGPVPALGAHTADVLREAGLTDAEIAALG